MEIIRKALVNLRMLAIMEINILRTAHPCCFRIIAYRIPFLVGHSILRQTGSRWIVGLACRIIVRWIAIRILIQWGTTYVVYSSCIKTPGLEERCYTPTHSSHISVQLLLELDLIELAIRRGVMIASEVPTMHQSAS